MKLSGSAADEQTDDKAAAVLPDSFNNQ